MINAGYSKSSAFGVICEGCGTNNSEGSKYCIECGMVINFTPTIDKPLKKHTKILPFVPLITNEQLERIKKELEANQHNVDYNPIFPSNEEYYAMQNTSLEFKPKRMPPVKIEPVRDHVMRKTDDFNDLPPLSTYVRGKPKTPKPTTYRKPAPLKPLREHLAIVEDMKRKSKKQYKINMIGIMIATALLFMLWGL